MDANALNNLARRTSDIAWPDADTAWAPATHPAATPPEVDQATLVPESRPGVSPVTVCADLTEVATVLDAQLGRCRRQARPATVLWVDVVVGDAEATRGVLRALGQRLRHHLRPADSVTQVGAQGFVVLLVDAGEQASTSVRSRLETVLLGPCSAAGAPVTPLPMRVGRAVHGLDGEDAEALLLVAVMWAGL